MGGITHFEIRSGDFERARGFWESLLGWKFRDVEGPMQYTMAEVGGNPTAGLYVSENSERGLVVYFDVDDVQAATDRVRELGGQVTTERTPIPEIGWFAHCVDTEGNPFGVFTADESVTMPDA
jgi:uncharacterized protein